MSKQTIEGFAFLIFMIVIAVLLGIWASKSEVDGRATQKADCQSRGGVYSEVASIKKYYLDTCIGAK